MNNTAIDRKRRSKNSTYEKDSISIYTRKESNGSTKIKTSANKFEKVAKKYFPDDFFYFAYRF